MSGMEYESGDASGIEVSKKGFGGLTPRQEQAVTRDLGQLWYSEGG